MSKLRVHSFSISIDRFSAGPGQDFENPLRVGGQSGDEPTGLQQVVLTQAHLAAESRKPSSA